jgi:hypothetical protein
MSSYIQNSIQEEGNLENSFCKNVQSEFFSSVVFDRDDVTIVNNCSPKPHSSSNEELTVLCSGEMINANFQTLASSFDLSFEEFNRSDVMIDNILHGTPIHLGELNETSNSLLSTEGKC